ncbi:MAG TPA: DNA replication and repair protein RecF [Gaiellaceae bacterium]|nr:DNA replication and repair protein RecF [Gaiellaceae bacterium]
MTDRTGLVVREVVLRDFRSYQHLELGLEPGVVLVAGANGSGKTNLLEALHVGTQGFSPRARSDAQLVRFGADAGRVALRGRNDAHRFESDVTVSRSEPRKARLNGEPLRSAEQLRSSFHTLVFTPDRLAVVKGGPGIRRAYLDRSLGRLFPSRATLAADYASALGQRNAALRRAALGLSSRDALSPWTERIAAAGRELVASRRSTLELLAAPFSTLAERIGLASASLAYDGEPPSTEELEARLERDLDRGFTGLGPHLHDVRIEGASGDLRTYGSQGEQRTAVLALVLAEASVLAERTGATPLVLLDDVLSELDAERRLALAEILSNGGQAVITTTTAAALPLEPAQALVVASGTIREE